jgi:uncharacterized phage protein gp47/JayE
MATLGAQITSAGIVLSDFANILQQLKIIYWQIYGSDANLDDDTQDGQFLTAIAQAISDSGQVAVDVYNGFSPVTAQGAQLSSLVKINGLARAVPTNSTVDVQVVGVAGTQINNGVVGDNLNLGTQWTLPSVVNIDDTGSVTVTATCTVQGNVAAAPNSITEILTPTRGWQTVNNADSAAPGLPVEDDATLRTQQASSTSLPALSVVDSIYASIAAISGVGRLLIYENDSDIADGNGLPPHSISPVVSGGDVTAIAQAIALKKTPGSGTYGSTSVQVLDSKGVPNTINFFVLALNNMGIQITIQPLAGYVSTTGDALIAAVAAFIAALAIGEDSYLARLYTPANLSGTGLGATFVVTSILQGPRGGMLVAADYAIAFNAAANILDPGDVTLVTL